MQPTAVCKRYVGLGGAVCDMTVCENESVGRKDESRSMTSLFSLGTRGSGAAVMDFDAYDCGCYALDDAADGA
jgi:hypothetical protein